MQVQINGMVLNQYKGKKHTYLTVLDRDTGSQVVVKSDAELKEDALLVPIVLTAKVRATSYKGLAGGKIVNNTSLTIVELTSAKRAG